MSIPTALDRILAPGAITALFQPVFEVDGEAPRLRFLEGLIRGPAGTHLEQAETLFDYVRRKRQEAVVDRACVAAVLEAAAALPGQPDLSVNAHAATLARDADFPALLASTAEANGVHPSRLIVEIVEHAPSWASRGLLAALHSLRSQGVRIALDDVGLGQSNYRMMLDVHPQYLKLDRYLVHDCHTDPYRRAVIESVVHLARKVEAEVVAEGAEVGAEVEALGHMGVDLAQGWFFSPALPASEVMARGFLPGVAPSPVPMRSSAPGGAARAVG